MKNKNRKVYVLDTSSIIYDVSILNKYSDATFIIPIVVLEELDKLKKLPNDAGKSARVAIRKLDSLSEKGDLTKGINIENGSTLKIDATYLDLKQKQFSGFGDPTYGDTQILALAYSLTQQLKDKEVALISNDINLRVKAKARGINAIKHETDNKNIDDIYSGYQVLANDKAGNELSQNGKISIKAYGLKLEPNECLIVNDKNGNELALGRRVSNDCVKLIKKVYPWNLSPRNKEQELAIDLLMDTNLDLVSLLGEAGTGKSLIILSCALELVLNKRLYDKIIIYRPFQPVAKDIGYTPGNIQEKLQPWFQAIVDNFEVLFSNKGSNDWKKELEMYQRKGKIEFEAFTYIRGRSISNAIVIFDEIQNINNNEMKTLLTRVGDNTKIIINGDTSQIDNKDLDASDNGLTNAIEAFKDSTMSGHITLKQGERSRLATLAAKLL